MTHPLFYLLRDDGDGLTTFGPYPDDRERERAIVRGYTDGSFCASDRLFTLDVTRGPGFDLELLPVLPAWATLVRLLVVDDTPALTDVAVDRIIEEADREYIGAER